MSGQPVSTASHPPHGHPDNTGPSTQASDKPSTASHPPSLKADPTTNVRPDAASKGSLSTTASASTPQQSGAQLRQRLKASLRQFPDFPSKGVLFEDILPLFADPSLHEDLITALVIHVETTYGPSKKPDVIVGLDARGFLFGPSLALRLHAGFVPVRKQGKLPGECATASFEKEYGRDFFQMQKGTIKQGQKVLVVDDIIATGGSAAAAGKLVNEAGGVLIGYLFMLELDFLKGRDKLDAPVHTLLSSQETKS